MVIIYLTNHPVSGDDPPSNWYNPVRHFASALFPKNCKHKLMLMLTSYMDETGHSRDEKSKFNGMAGLLCKAEEWELFERRWKRILSRFNIPYIHMRESLTMFEGWSETKLNALSTAAWDAIKRIKPLPLGSIFPMDVLRPLEEKIRFYFDDPYFIAMQDCMKGVLASVIAFPDRDVKVAMVFSDQVEFKYNAQHMFEAIRAKMPPEVRGKIDPPDFRDMRNWGSLQAADMVAYEIYKERERTYYGLPRDRRYGYKRVLDIYETQDIDPLGIRYYDAASVADIISLQDYNRRMEEYWEKKRLGQGKDRE